MISTERGEVSLAGDAPRHGFSRRLHSMGSGLWLGAKRLLSTQAFRSKHVEGLGKREVATLTDVEIGAIPIHEISMLDTGGMRRWKGAQLEAMASGQLQALSADQLAIFVANSHLTADQLERLIKALSSEAHVGKISVVLQALHGDSLEDRKIVVLADCLLNECTRFEAQEVLVVFSRAATDSQFEVLVEAMPFWFIQELADHEMNNPNLAEFERLDLRVEERQLSNSYRLMQLIRNADAIELQHQRLVNGELTDLDPKKAPWRSCAPALVDALRVRLLQGIQTEEELRESDRILCLIKLDMNQKQIHLQTENCRVEGMLELWNASYLDDGEAQAVLLAKVIRPQAQLLQEISGLLLFKQNDPEISDEEKVVLVQTLEQGCRLAEAMQPEIRQAKRLAIQLKADHEFLEESTSFFLDLIRHETRLGRFSMEFFRRMMRVEDNEKVYHILHGDGFEELIVSNPQLNDGLALTKETNKLIARVQELQEELQRLTEELSVDKLANEMKLAALMLDS